MRLLSSSAKAWAFSGESQTYNHRRPVPGSGAGQFAEVNALLPQDDVWDALDEGLNAVVVSTLKAGTGKTASLPLLRRWFRIEDVSANFL